MLLQATSDSISDSAVNEAASVMRLHMRQLQDLPDYSEQHTAVWVAHTDSDIQSTCQTHVAMLQLF
jgi:hypothetical protein